MQYVIVELMDFLSELGILVGGFSGLGGLVADGLGLFLEGGFVQVVDKHRIGEMLRIFYFIPVLYLLLS
jgi:hypothetical protein